MDPGGLALAVGRVLVLGGEEVGALLAGGLDLLGPLEEALRAFSSGAASAPPRVAAMAPRGWLGAMPAYLPGSGLAAKLVSVFPENGPAPSHQGVVALFDEGDGSLLSLMDGRLVTSYRTAAVSAISMRLLGGGGARILAVLGSGEQARAHLELLPRVAQFGEVRIGARSQARARALAEAVPGCSVAESLEDAVLGADVVACCTAATSPVVLDSWLGTGAHLISVGSGPEVEPATIARARLFVEWRGAGTNPPPAGAAELQLVDPAQLTELGELLDGAQPGREAADQLTVFKSTGLGVEDAAVAGALFRAAREAGRGQMVPW